MVNGQWLIVNETKSIVQNSNPTAFVGAGSRWRNKLCKYSKDFRQYLKLV